MKRFLVFCSIIVVVVALGYTVVFFLQDTEKLRVASTLYQMNVGETNSLEWKLEKAKASTTVSYEIEEESKSVIQLDEKTKEMKALKGGIATIKIVTNNSNIADVAVEIHVGDGSKEYPYYIRNAGDLASIGATTVSQGNINPFRVEDSYMLTSGVSLSGTWVPIKGAFTGTFYGEGYTISGMTINGDGENAGLFESIGTGGCVQYVNFDGANIAGNYSNAGIVAGSNSGEIKNVHIINSSITNTREGANTGAICGQNLAVATTAGNISKSSVSCKVDGKGVVGGIVGLNKGSYVYNCYTKEATTVINGSASGVAGGIVGENTELDSTFAVVKDCYNLAGVSSSNTNVGAIAGKHNYDDSKDPKVINLVVGCYYESKEGLVAVVGYKDIEPSTSQDDQFTSGVMGAVGKTLNELRSQSSFVSHISKSTKKAIAWDFNEAWKLENNSTPSINADGADIRLNLGSLNIGGKTLIDSDAMSKINMNGIYTIESDIDMGGAIWEPLSGVISAPSGDRVVGFSGYLSGTWLEEEGRFTKIYNFKLSDSTNAGFFDTIEENGEVCNLVFEAVTTPNENGANVTNFGIVAGVNKGNVHDITISGTSGVSKIKVNGGEKTVNAGGVVGLNSGIVTKCYVNDLYLTNTVNNVDIPTYVGGVVGQNCNYVTFCGVNKSEINRVSTYYGAVGGVVGIASETSVSEPVIRSCYVTNSVTITANYSYTGGGRTNSFAGHVAGGIVGENWGDVYYNAFAGTVNGFAVGGVTGYARDDVYENQTTINSLMKGCLVGGVAGYQSVPDGSADIYNNSIEGTLFGVEYNSANKIATYKVSSDETYKAGIVAGGGMVFTDGSQVYAYNNFISVSFAGVGVNKVACWGFVSKGSTQRHHNVFNTTLVKDTTGENLWDSFSGWANSLVNANDEGNVQSGENDIISSDYKSFRNAGFSDSVWCLDATVNEKFPVLYNVVKMP